MTISVSVGLLVLRVLGGLTIAAHGGQKLFGWFGGPGFAKYRQGQVRMGFHPALLWACLAVLGELGGGLSLAFGFLTPLGAAGMIGAMFMAIAKVHWKNGFFNSNRGIEFPLSLLAIAAGIGLAGPGAYSLDSLFALNLPTPVLFLILAAAAIIVDLIGLAISRAVSRAPAPAPATAPEPTVRAS